MVVNFLPSLSIHSSYTWKFKNQDKQTNGRSKCTFVNEEFKCLSTFSCVMTLTSACFGSIIWWYAVRGIRGLVVGAWKFRTLAGAGRCGHVPAISKPEFLWLWLVAVPVRYAPHAPMGIGWTQFIYFCFSKFLHFQGTFTHR